MVRFKRGAPISESDLRKLMREHGFSHHTASYRLHGEADVLEYRTVIRTMQPVNLERLSTALSRDPNVLEYRLAPTSE